METAFDKPWPKAATEPTNCRGAGLERAMVKLLAEMEQTVERVGLHRTQAQQDRACRIVNRRPGPSWKPC